MIMIWRGLKKVKSLTKFCALIHYTKKVMFTSVRTVFLSYVEVYGRNYFAPHFSADLFLAL